MIRDPCFWKDLYVLPLNVVTKLRVYTQAVQGKCTLTMTHLPSLLLQRTGGHCLGTFRATGRPTLHDEITTLSRKARNLPPSETALRSVLQYQSLKKSDLYLATYTILSRSISKIQSEHIQWNCDFKALFNRYNVFKYIYVHFIRSNRSYRWWLSYFP